MRKSCNYKVMKKKIKIVLKNSLDPEPDSESSGSVSELIFLAGSGSGFN